MRVRILWLILSSSIVTALILFHCREAKAQLIDRTLAPNYLNEGIAKSLVDEIGMGRGDVMTPESTISLINRDPFRAIRRGRQLFQRKFTRADGQGPVVQDGVGNIVQVPAIGAGLADSC